MIQILSYNDIKYLRTELQCTLQSVESVLILRSVICHRIRQGDSAVNWSQFVLVWRPSSFLVLGIKVLRFETLIDSPYSVNADRTNI